jgi:anthranilate phosphoribosyltransferase
MRAADFAQSIHARTVTAAPAFIPRPRRPDGDQTGIPDAVRAALSRISLGLPTEPGMLTRAFAGLTAMPERHGADSLLASLMTGVVARGPAFEDLVELLDAGLALDARDPIDLPECDGRPVVVLAGSGKKSLPVECNITTPSAIVAAAAGVAVVKMGSHATSSAMGSRDLARVLGLPEARSELELRADLARHQFAFVPIEETIPHLHQVYGNRFFVINPFSFGLAALASPVRGHRTIYGLAHSRLDLAASVLGHFGITEATVIGSADASGSWADEYGLGATSSRCRLRSGHLESIEHTDTAALIRSSSCEPRTSTGSRAQVAVAALSGEGPEHTIALVALNAGLVLHEAGIAADLADGVARARAAIDSGTARALLQRIREGQR